MIRKALLVSLVLGGILVSSAAMLEPTTRAGSPLEAHLTPAPPAVRVLRPPARVRSQGLTSPSFLSSLPPGLRRLLLPIFAPKVAPYAVQLPGPTPQRPPLQGYSCPAAAAGAPDCSQTPCQVYAGTPAVLQTVVPAGVAPAGSSGCVRASRLHRISLSR